ncbi:hypothetical protein OESDEN_14252 [Oesophagostomum dentatum]|uniref:Uncharacterized protein n=1 Tax=Oesophagostomum dentatum TaxID=61180 RepID=A0A0B1SS15_OESDE|nr:hypothetical protein OESDEN_14252 [Oesophagostomum dentatum]
MRKGKVKGMKEKPKPIAPPKLAPLPVMPAPKKGSPRSMYNTFLTEHFENAQITKAVVPFKPFDFATAFMTSGPPPEEPRSTEEMRADTLYKVQDQFEDLILPPLKDIDHSLSYLRELDEQATQTVASDHESWLPSRILKAFLNPLAKTQPGSSASLSPKPPIDRMLKTQTEEEEQYDPMKDHPSRLKAALMSQIEVTAPDVDADEVTPRPPERESQVTKSSMALQPSRQRSIAIPAPPPSLVSSVVPKRRRGHRTLRQRLIRLKNLFSGSREPAQPVQHSEEEAGQN